MMQLSSGRSALSCSWRPGVAHPVQLARPAHAHAPRPRVLANAAATFAPAQLQHTVGHVGGDDEASPGWAIVKLGGTQHFVDLGATVAVRSDQLQVSEGGKVRWSQEVLAAKHPLSGQLYRGGPHVVVEGAVQDEFEGPGSPAQALQLTRVLITRIDVEPPVTKQPQQL